MSPIAVASGFCQQSDFNSAKWIRDELDKYWCYLLAASVCCLLLGTTLVVLGKKKRRGNKGMGRQIQSNTQVMREWRDERTKEDTNI